MSPISKEIAFPHIERWKMRFHMHLEYELPIRSAERLEINPRSR